MKYMNQGLINLTIDEINRLLNNKVPNNEFLLFVLNMLTTCKNSRYLVKNDCEEDFRLIGCAAVRALDSFDSTPDIDKFLDLAGKISAQINLFIKKLSWTQSNNTFSFFMATTDKKQSLLIKINDYPIETKYTLFVDGEKSRRF